MALAHILMFLWVLAPGSAVYVKGHSQAADKVRQTIESFTCYTSGTKLETSAATLQVDHIMAKSSGRSWVGLVLTDVRQRVLYEKKAEEYPWPFPSPSARLLRDLAKSTCPGYQSARLQVSVAHPGQNPLAPPLIHGSALVPRTAN